jgi:hypothetical protein
MKDISIIDNWGEQYIEINGIKYSYDLFEEWGINGMPEGTKFELVKRENGKMIIKRLED